MSGYVRILHRKELGSSRFYNHSCSNYSYHTFNAGERKEVRGGGLLAPEMDAGERKEVRGGGLLAPEMVAVRECKSRL